MYSLLATVLFQQAASGPSWEVVIGTLIGFAGTVAGLFLTGKLRLGTQYDDQAKQYEQRIAEIKEADKAQLEGERQQFKAQLDREIANGGKFEKMAMASYDNLDELRDQLGIALKAVATLTQQQKDKEASR